MPEQRTALVVDDDEGSRRLLATVLKQSGWQVLEATNGEEGVKCAQIVPVDLVLLDLRLPGPIDGLKAVCLLRQDPVYRQVPILAVSASGYDDFRQRALAAGCNAFVSKPVNLRELRKQIESLTRPQEVR